MAFEQSLWSAVPRHGCRSLAGWAGRCEGRRPGAAPKAASSRRTPQNACMPARGRSLIGTSFMEAEMTRSLARYSGIVLILCSLAPLSSAPAEEKIVLTPKPGPQPRINGARIFGVRPGSPFLFTIPATGERPMEFAVDALPKGLSLETKHRSDHRQARRARNLQRVFPGVQPARPGPARVPDRLRRHAGAHPAHGLEQLVCLGKSRDRPDHARGGGRHGRQRHDRPRVHVRQHRRLLVGEAGVSGRVPPGAAARHARPRERQPALPRYEGAHRVYPCEGAEGGHLHVARPADLRQARRRLAARAAGRGAVRGLGIRFPEIRLVLL